MESAVNQLPQMDLANNYLALSREFQELQLYSKAEDTLLLALEKLPQQPFLLIRLAELYLKLDMPEKALEISDRLIRHHTKLKFPYYLRGKIMEDLGDQQEAIVQYQAALKDSLKDTYVLLRLLPLLLFNDRAADALRLIVHYQEMSGDKLLFAARQAQALMELGLNARAFARMRDAIRHRPDDRELLDGYLQLAIRTGKKGPREVYHILELSLPNLIRLSEDDLVDLELDYLAHKRDFVSLKARMAEVLTTNGKKYYWRKKCAFLLLEMGEIEKSVSELRKLFLVKSADVKVRKALENYYLMTNQVETWKVLVKKVIRRGGEQFALFNYLRSIGKDTDWLAICEMDYDRFMSHLGEVNLVHSDISDVTFIKLPAYALEIFISQVAIHQNIPDPDALWMLICREREKKNQVPPFHLEDLEAAYPVWIFALHIYFLFRSESPFPVAFVPRLFQSEQVAVLLKLQSRTVQVDIQPLLNSHKRHLKPVVKASRGLRWRWHADAAHPDQMHHEVHFYGKEPFAEVLAGMTAQLAAQELKTTE